MTATLEGGEWSAARPGRTLPPGKTRHPFYKRLSGPQGRSGRAENLVHTGIRSRTVQPVVSRYTDWATRPTRCNNIQFTYICKLLYMFRLVFPPIISSSYHCIYRPLLQTVVSVTLTTVSSNGLNNDRCCRYSDMSSWWWVEIPPETCRAVCGYKSTVYCCILLYNYWHIIETN